MPAAATTPVPTGGTLIYWFRNDLRLTDAPALGHAARLAQDHRLALLPMACLAPAQWTRWAFARIGVHRQRVLHATLDDLRHSLRALGSDLRVLHGAPATTLPALCRLLGVSHIVWEDIAAPEEEAEVRALRAAGLRVDTVWQSSLLDPAQLPFAPHELPDVFTAFRQRMARAACTPPAPLPVPTTLPQLPSSQSPALRQFFEENQAVAQFPPALTATEIIVLERQSSHPYHTPEFAGGERAALAHVRRYLAAGLPHSYKATRNQLFGRDFSSKLSLWLASGALSVRTVYAELKAFEAERGANEGSDWLVFELLWRDYFRFLHRKYGARLYHAHGLWATTRPPTGIDTTAAQVSATSRMPTTQPQPSAPSQALQRWCLGETGTPLVDAAMRELRASGYLSNRMRQVAASYWLHELQGDWRAGAAWFESQLVDYDVYSNTGNWLYIAGLGTDPRGGRHFDVAKQAREHDPHSRYQRMWLDG